MCRLLAAAATLFILLGAAPAALADNPKLRIETSKGPITVELYPDQAPATVANFLEYVDAGFYTGTVFHRVIKGFMIQGGGFDKEMRKKATRAPIKNEADNGLKNKRGTLAMARTMEPHSATAQFFINHKDNAFLDHKSKDRRGWGYAVFGKVTDGMEVVDEIAATPTGAFSKDGKDVFSKDVPKDGVVIEKITRLDG
ncbi:peptidylprolyl isomerase [Candidatus Thiosymbion oneisti]|uniref:peptidylprolyl isomerase n=1 Tax=Candidatus Thiosymbion oneisti TaxID=589554 RepID=UPI000A7B7244|nr:peptidylprolyl isomerase [Candidatus Thiosymbion oneisti]